MDILFLLLLLLYLFFIVNFSSISTPEYLIVYTLMSSLFILTLCDLMYSFRGEIYKL